MKGEETLYQANPAMFRNHPFWFISILASCVGLLVVPAIIRDLPVLVICALLVVFVGLPIMLVWWFRCKGTTLRVTNERTVLRRGILAKSTNEVWHRDVRNVQVTQTVTQRIMGVGTLGISSAGQAGVEIGVKGIPNPYQVREIIDQYRRRSG